MSEWKNWTGGYCPVPKGTVVKIEMRDGILALETAESLDWRHYGTSGDIIKYHVIEEAPRPELKVAPVQFGEGWAEHDGKEACPVNPCAKVHVVTRDGFDYRGRPASGFKWKHDGDSADVIKYRLVEDAPESTPEQPTSALNVQVAGDHYKKLKIQPIEYIHANNIPFAEGSAIKYLTRWRDKGGVKDLEKAKHFIEMLIELESKGNAS